MTFDVDAYDKNGDVIVNLVQWDRDVFVHVELDQTLSADGVYYMNFFNCSSPGAYMVDTSYDNGMLKAKIPNILLQDPKPITGYIFLSEYGEKRGILRVRINVRPMPKPSTYAIPDDKDYLQVVSVLEECIAYAECAKQNELNTAQSERNTAAAAQKAAYEASTSENYAKISESWAIGNTGVRDGEDVDNSKYYSEQSKIHKETIEDISIYSKSYVVGGTGTRDGEDTDNIKYYYNNIKTLSANFEVASLDEAIALIGVDTLGG